jgi:twitching motility protein PilT
MLVQQGVVSEVQLDAAQEHAGPGGNLARSLVELQLATEGDLVRAFATSLDLPYTEVGPDTVDPTVAALLSGEDARALTALPVRFADDGSLLVAIADPKDPMLAPALESTLGMPVTLALAPRRALREAIEALNSVPGTTAATPGTAGGATLAPVPDLPTHANGAGAHADPMMLASEEEPSIDIDDLLKALVEGGGSDLHLTEGIPPAIRINGDLHHLDDQPVMTAEGLQQMLYAIMTQKQRETSENQLELDMSYAVPNLARFRINVFQQRDSIGSVMRVIPFEILPLEDLGVPQQVADFAYLPRGFVLVTGPTGSGKSTTLASLIDLHNRNRPSHIMTVEDPIEFLHTHKQSVVNQREVGTDTHGFAAALKHVLRQDPDVILVGELRDLETIQIALTAAETGHLVFATLHTQDAPQTIDRVVDVFPPHQQEQIRVMLAGALRGVVCQTLLKTADGKGRTVACEVMTATSGIRNLIREGKTHQIYSAIQAGASHGMVAMDQSLATLVKQGKVTYDTALEKCNNVQEFNRLAGRA